MGGYHGMPSMFSNAGHYLRDVVPQSSTLLYAAKVQIGKEECDKDPQCHSFTVATWEGEKDGHNVCLYTGGAMDFHHDTNWDAYVKSSSARPVMDVSMNK